MVTRDRLDSQFIELFAHMVQFYQQRRLKCQALCPLKTQISHAIFSFLGKRTRPFGWLSCLDVAEDPLPDLAVYGPIIVDKRMTVPCLQRY